MTSLRGSVGRGPRPGLAGEVAHPEREPCGGDPDHDRPAPGEHRVDRQCGESDGDREKEERKRATLHDAEATLLRATQGRGSIGRAPVSKTGGCRFESCRPC